MNRRNLIKGLAAAPLAPLAVEAAPAKGIELFEFQKRAIKLTETFDKVLYIWPRGSSKTFTFRYLVEKYLTEKGLSLGLIASMVNLIGYGPFHDILWPCSYSFQYSYQRSSFAPESLGSIDNVDRVYLFTSVTPQNEKWLIENMDKFDYVDHRGIDEIDFPCDLVYNDEDPNRSMFSMIQTNKAGFDESWLHPSPLSHCGPWTK